MKKQNWDKRKSLQINVIDPSREEERSIKGTAEKKFNTRTRIRV